MAKYYDADTCVFWDVVDFPVPVDRMLDEFRSKVERALRVEGYIGKLKIQAYGGEDADRMDFLCAKMQLVHNAAEKHVRLSRMQLDILYWAFWCFHGELEHNETNFLVIAKDVPGEDTGFLNLLETLTSKGYNVFLVVPDDVPLEQVPRTDTAALVWRWTNLFDGRYPILDDLGPDTSSDEEESSQCAEKRPGICDGPDSSSDDGGKRQRTGDGQVMVVPPMIVEVGSKDMNFI